MPTKSVAIRLSLDGKDEVDSGLADTGSKGESAFNKIADASKKAGDQVEQTGRKFKAHNDNVNLSADAWTKFLMKLDPATKAQVQYIKYQEQLNAFMKAGVVSTSDYAIAQGALKAKFEGTNKSAKDQLDVLELIKGSLGALGVAYGLSAVVSFGQGVFSDTAALKDQSEQIGESIEGLQAHRIAMEQDGIAQDAADQIIQRLTRTIGQAVDAAGTQREAFVQLGLTANDLAGGTEAVLPKVATALLSISDANTRARLETELFGKSGQTLESALHDLATPTDELIEKYRQMGLVLDPGLVNAANKSQNAITLAFTQLKVQAAPAVTFLTDRVTDLVRELNLLATGNWKPAGLAWLYGFGAVDAQQQGGKPSGSVPGLRGSTSGGDTGSGSAPNAAGGFATPGADAFVRQLQMDAQLAGQSAKQRAVSNALITEANTLLREQGVTEGGVAKTVGSTAEAEKVIVQYKGQGTLAEIRTAAAAAQTAQAYQKVKETLAGYLTTLDQAAQAASLGRAEQEKQAAVIKAAQIDQRARGVDEKAIVKDYQSATKELGEQNTALVRNKIEQASINDLTRDMNQAISDNVVLLQTARDKRELESQILQEQARLGRDLTETEKQRLATLQAIHDQMTASDILADMREQVYLASLMPNEREKEEAILQAIHETHGNITEAQAQEIANMIELQRQTQAWNDLTTATLGDLKSFLKEGLTTGTFDLKKFSQASGGDFADFLINQAFSNVGAGSGSFSDTFAKLTGLASGKRDGSSAASALYVQFASANDNVLSKLFPGNNGGIDGLDLTPPALLNFPSDLSQTLSQSSANMNTQISNAFSSSAGGGGFLSQLGSVFDNAFNWLSDLLGSIGGGGSGGGIGGFLGSIFGSGGLGGLFGGSSAASGSFLDAGTPILGDIGFAHMGGNVESLSQRKVVNLAAFRNAMRAHAGAMLGADEIPIIAKKGERVLNPSETRDYNRKSGGGVSPASITYAPVNYFYGVGMDQVLTLVTQQQDKFRREVPGLAISAYREASKRRVI